MSRACGSTANSPAKLRSKLAPLSLLPPAGSGAHPDSARAAPLATAPPAFRAGITQESGSRRVRAQIACE